MPSFIFLSSKDEADIDQIIRDGSQCVVPEGFEGLRGEVESRYSNLRWHCGAHAPVEHHKSHGSGYAFLIGEAISEDSDDYLSAAELFELVTKHRDDAAVRLSRFSGFFAWIVVLDDESTYCGSDPFGFFPVYYFQGKNSIGIATSLNALHAHPEYDRSIDPVGFCRYLLENGCSSQRTLEKSGKRLNITESISYSPESGELLKMQHAYPGQNAVKSVHHFDDAIQLSIKASSKAVERHIQRPVDTCLLSGGLDSRQVLSIAHKLGKRPKCVTLGVRHSYESINARKVARQLDLPWECSGGFTEPPARMLDDELDLLSLGGGFHGILFWWRHVTAIQGTRYLTGLFLDITYGLFGKQPRDTDTDAYTFTVDTLIYNFGVFPDEFAELLLQKEYKEALDVARAEIRSEWEASNPDPHERRWQTVARYRARSHHGGIAWKNAFYNWPVIPALDVPLTEAIRSIDGQLLLDRKLQKEAFMAMEPELAAIPFASISAKPRPLIHTRRNKYHRRLEKIERRSLRWFDKCFRPEISANNTSIQSWQEATRRALDQLDTVAELFDTDKVEKSIADSYDANNPKKKSFTRNLYSQRLLVGGICWLASRQTKPENSRSNI